jgi:hypothetical protein
MAEVEPPKTVGCELLIVENDARSKQFACKIVLTNYLPRTVDILAINYRFGRGVAIQKNDDESIIDSRDDYDKQRNDVRGIVNAIYVNANKEFRDEYIKNSLKAFEEQLSLRKMSHLYLYLVTGRLSLFRKSMQRAYGRYEFPITNSGEATDALTNVKNKNAAPEGLMELLEAKIRRMVAIESRDENFLRPEYVTQLAPAESYERVYVIKATRSFASIASYSIGFDVKLGWSEEQLNEEKPRAVERIISRTTSFNVTPSPLTLSIFAIVFSIVGVLLASLPSFTGEYYQLFELKFIKQYFVAGALAIILYNSLEMTEFGDKIKSISWRSAMFVGVLCGLLSERMLQAITAFVK